MSKLVLELVDGENEVPPEPQGTCRFLQFGQYIVFVRGDENNRVHIWLYDQSKQKYISTASAEIQNIGTYFQIVKGIVSDFNT